MKVWLRLICSLAALAALPMNPFAADAAHPTVVELFQSQGCSDCPPAYAYWRAVHSGLENVSFQPSRSQ